MPILFTALPETEVRQIWSGGTDSYGAIPETAVSDGDGVPCRHCLKPIGNGENYLILAWRPFPRLQPYAETGPIFLHALPCQRAPDSEEIPDILTSPDYIVRGYGAKDRIIYGTGAVVPTAEIPGYAAKLFEQADVAYIHVRSARNNCYQCRVERA